ncbi:MAG: PAS domain-containing protein [Kiloniellaceae bacterium]
MTREPVPTAMESADPPSPTADGRAPGIWRDIAAVAAMAAGIFALLAAFGAGETLTAALHPFRYMEHIALDELILSLVALAPGALWFAARRWREARREMANRRVADAKLTAVLDDLEHQVEIRTRELAASERRAVEAHSRLLEAVEAVGDGFAFFDREDRLILCNDRYRQIFAGLGDLIRPGVRFEHLVRVAARRKLHLDSLHNPDAWVRERLRAHQRAQGTFVQRMTNGRWILANEHRTGDGQIIATYVDVSELKRAEEMLRSREQQLRLITDAVPILIAYVDADQRFGFINRTGELWYAADREKIIGRRMSDVLAPSEMARLQPLVARVLTGEKVSEQLSIGHPDGRRRVVRITYIPRLGEAGTVLGFFGLGEDITEQYETKNRLRQAQKMEALGQLTGGIAHDFNNILGVVLGNLELLEDRLKNEALLRTATEIATKAALRGAALTERLLAFSRKQVLSPRGTDLREIVSETVDFAGAALGSSVRVEVDLAADLWPVMVDPAQLQTALLNLAINARDAMPDGGTLTFHAANADLAAEGADPPPAMEPGHYVHLAVHDSGAGMPEEVRRHAFDPFFTTKKVGHGSGLGLSMVYGFINQTGGHVAIASEPDRGTTVELYLPRAAALAPEDAAAPKCAAAFPGNGETVLVVEDDAALRHMAVQKLTQIGYVALEANDGRAALATLTATPGVDLLFVDAVLPNGPSGIEVAHTARRSKPSIKVVLTTGHQDTSALGALLEEDGVELLRTPYRRSDLARAIYTILDHGDDAPARAATGPTE